MDAELLWILCFLKTHWCKQQLFLHHIICTYIERKHSLHSSSLPSSHNYSMELPDSLTICPYHPSPMVSLLGCIFCQCRADESLCWSANTDKSMCRCSQENVAYEFVLTFLWVSCMPCEIGSKCLYSCWL